MHRDGMIGEQARDSLLLCMSLSKNNDKVAEYIITQSNICPVCRFTFRKKFSQIFPKICQHFSRNFIENSLKFFQILFKISVDFTQNLSNNFPEIFPTVSLKFLIFNETSFSKNFHKFYSLLTQILFTIYAK